MTNWVRTVCSTGCALLLVLGTIAGIGCAQRPTIPPVTADAAAKPAYGKFVWYDLLTENPDDVRRFYSELFGWTFQATEATRYTLILHHGQPIGGIVDMTDSKTDVNESQWISVLSVPDVDAAVKTTTAAGGTVHVSPVNIPGRGRLAVIDDPQGALVALLRAKDGDPPDEDAGLGDWLWTELWTGDPDAAAKFYGELIGYQLDETALIDDPDYTIFERDGTPRAGVILNPHEEVRSNWLPYLRVEDPAGLAARVEGLGGRVILKPSEDIRQGSVAIVIDPAGAAVALQQWPAS